MLTTLLKEKNLSEVLVSRADFRPFPRYDDRKAWQAIAPDARAFFDGLSRSLHGADWPALPAAWYMDFYRNGNRTRYEAPCFERRRRLYTLLVAECMQGDGRFIDDIINGAWAICEESTWVLPAHISSYEYQDLPRVPLVDLENPMVELDLISAETGALLSWVYALLGERLAVESPILPRRIALEIDRRIFQPYLARSDYFWMGFSHEGPMNNWCIWIVSNVLAATLNVEADPARRTALVSKMAYSIQRFLDTYALDGGCDEGSGYFNVAGASLLDTLALLDHGTGGAVSLYGQPKVQNIGKYIMQMHIGGQWYVNFADAGARFTPDALLLLRTAEKTGQPDLAAFAKAQLRAGNAMLPYEVGYENIYRRLTSLFQYDPAAYASAPDYASRGYYFPSIQVATARDNTGPKGLFFAAKGNHNGESHNHNDVGSYIVALDGVPVIIDAGVETYRKETFGPDRYSIWTMRSDFHNTAILNGYHQSAGGEYAARDAAYGDRDDLATFSLDIADAYPKTAGVLSYRRTFVLDRAGSTLAVTDAAQFAAAQAPTVLPLMAADPPQLDTGEIRLPAAGRTLRLLYDAGLFEAEVEAIPLEDPKLQAVWQRDRLYRLLLRRKACAAAEQYTLCYSIQ